MLPTLQRAPTGWLVAALMAHGLVGLGYLQALPTFNWPDEPAHFNRVRDLVRGHGFGVMEPGAWAPETLARLQADRFRGLEEPATGTELDVIRYQAHQPPLYYLVAAGLYRLWPSTTGLKLLNLALSCLALAVAVSVARRVAPAEPWIAVGTGVLLALLPMRCFMAVSIGNDVAAELVFALFALAVVRGAGPVRIGLLVGAGLLVKASLALALPLYAVWLGGRWWSGPAQVERTAWRAVGRPWMLAAVVAVAVASPWLARNVALYGWTDPLALSAGALGWQAAGIARPGLELTGEHGLLPFALILFQSWWGVFGWMEMFPEPRVLAVYLVLTVLALVGWARCLAAHVRSRSGVSSLGSKLWLAAALGAFFVAVALYSLADFQPQGRYLLTASAASGVLFGSGLAAACGRFAWWGTVATASALLVVNLHTIRSVIPWYLASGG